MSDQLIIDLAKILLPVLTAAMGSLYMFMRWQQRFISERIDYLESKLTECLDRNNSQTK